MVPGWGRGSARWILILHIKFQSGGKIHVGAAQVVVCIQNLLWASFGEARKISETYEMSHLQEGFSLVEEVWEAKENELGRFVVWNACCRRSQRQSDQNSIFFFNRNLMD